MDKRIIILLLPFLFCFCKRYDGTPVPSKSNQPGTLSPELGFRPTFQQPDTLSPELGFRPTFKTIASRFPPPAGFERISASPNSFAEYLQNLPLKPDGTPVRLFDGTKKWRQDVHAAVIDLDVGKRDLQQCADAVMRLRAEHLFTQKKYADIHFNFVNGFRADYATWRRGNRIRVNGNAVKWEATERESMTYASFRKYMDMVFSYAGTLSLAKEMRAVPLSEMQIGDVFIYGGSPGHAVIVVDMAEHLASGKKCFLLAQSYMPAQDIHVLKNPAGGTWYSLGFSGDLATPEWTFSEKDLKRF